MPAMETECTPTVMQSCSHQPGASSEAVVSAYKQTEKRFKPSKATRGQAAQELLLRDVIDFARPEDSAACDRLLRVPVSCDAPPWLQNSRVYALRGRDGFRFICNPFSDADQLRWAEAALCTWNEPPNLTNLNLHHGQCHALWQQHQQDPQQSMLSRLRLSMSLARIPD